MEHTRSTRRARALALLALATSLGLLLSPHAGGVAGAAGSNSADGLCVKAYNYADPHQGWLHATTESKGCHNVQVRIENQAILAGGPGFEGSNCNGPEWWGHQSGELFVGVSVLVDVSQWANPCSQHAGTSSSWWPTSSGAIYFQCSQGCYAPRS